MLSLDSQLRREMTLMIAPSYEDTASLMDRELTACDTLYIDRDPDGSLKCFFMVGWQDLLVDGRTRKAVYLGLSASSVKNTGRIRGLYDRLNSDAVKWQETNGSLILWFTTALPSAYYAGSTIYDDPDPRFDAKYSEESLQIVAAIRRKHGYPDDGHPFVLKRVAEGTRYSASETERIAGICKKKDFRLFQNWGLMNGMVIDCLSSVSHDLSAALDR